MIDKNLIFDSLLAPALVTIGDVTYVVPGWHIVPNGTTLEEVYEHRKLPEKYQTQKSNIGYIKENVLSERTGESYTVEFNGNYWSCTCMGFGFRRTCKHCDKVKLKYITI